MAARDIYRIILHILLPVKWSQKNEKLERYTRKFSRTIVWRISIIETSTWKLHERSYNGILSYKRLPMFDKHLRFSKHFWYKHFSINVLGKLDIKYQLIYEIIYFFNCETIHKTIHETE